MTANRWKILRPRRAAEISHFFAREPLNFAFYGSLVV
jgi:hypothetical protein